MATLTSLIQALQQKVNNCITDPPLIEPLSDAQYSDGFNSAGQGAGWSTYQNFIIPQLRKLLEPLINSRDRISVLEIGPGPKSVLGYLPSHQRQQITRYTAFEPNEIFANKLENMLGYYGPHSSSPLPALESPPVVHHGPFLLDRNAANNITVSQKEKFDIILFCHSLYGMSPHHKYIAKALSLLVPLPTRGLVVVFHREESLDIDGLVCHHTASFPEGFLSIQDEDEVIDTFAPFVAGFAVRDDTTMGRAIRAEWRKMCRDMGRHHDDENYRDKLMFRAPEVVKVFTQHAAVGLPRLIKKVPAVKGAKTTKKPREARLHRPAAIVRPTNIKHVQECIRWAIEHNVSLTILNGGQTRQGVWSGVVAVDMGAFNQVEIIRGVEDTDGETTDEEYAGPLVVAGAGCSTGYVIHKAMKSGLTVPLGSRPGEGADAWLQGSIGHLARQYGLTCDAIVGAVLVKVDPTREVLCIGNVPKPFLPAGAVRAENESDLLWAVKGAGTNFGIVLSVVFRAYAAPKYSVRHWSVMLDKSSEQVCCQLRDFDKAVKELPHNCSVYAHTHGEGDQLRLSVAMTGVFTDTGKPTQAIANMQNLLGPGERHGVVDGINLFDITKVYLPGIHSVHGGKKMSLFTRSVFLKDVGSPQIAQIIVAALERRPSSSCYFRLLQGGGAARDVAADDTGFGSRDWDFACEVNSAWPSDGNGTETAISAVHWVYSVVTDLLPLSTGVCAAGLGPDPRDAALAAKVFVPNRPRLARLKRIFDPQNVLAYACPLPEDIPSEPRLIVVVTGKGGAGKDYCADRWACVFNRQRRIRVKVSNISENTEREYAIEAGVDPNRMLHDRVYRELHRPALTKFFEAQLRERPHLLKDHFLEAVIKAAHSDVDVLFVTGVRDEAPVAAFSHLVPGSRLIEVRVQASRKTRYIRRRLYPATETDADGNSVDPSENRPSFVFNNDETGDEMQVESFAELNLIPFFHEKLQRLERMVRVIPDFPRPGVKFRHVLDIAERRGGLALCTSLLQSHFNHADWTGVDVIVACEGGGVVFAAALAARVGVPLALIREEGKIPPPSVSVGGVVMNRDAITQSASVVVVGDVLASGATLCAVLEMLTRKCGARQADINVLVVAEFPMHRGRNLLRQRGFGGVCVQSLLVIGS
ncbi:phosphoribosyl transferase domain protein [Apiospora arundinis]|uniref:Phosphoribosyl transferase domain protein n=1 Tax=Apiospora arundinis TaxID=335852 RepID=A0ABR2I4F3_9PEZI